jgi:hypothetical protein
MTTTMTTDLLALATDRPTDVAVEPCGCMMTPDGFKPCDTCKAEVAADLAEVYKDAGDWRLKGVPVAKWLATRGW